MTYNAHCIYRLLLVSALVVILQYSIWQFCVLSELVFGVKVRISGDLKQLSSTSPTLIIMNHRTRFDWLFFWCFLLRQGRLRK